MKKAIIIGSGVGGLATALRLKAQGLDVLVFENNSYPGGKLSSFTLGKYRFDAGPSLLTMPHYIDELFELFDEKPQDTFSRLYSIRSFRNRTPKIQLIYQNLKLL